MRMKFTEIAFALVLTTGAAIGGLTSVVSGFAQTIGNITISSNWIRATPPAARVGGGFLVVTNSADTDDTLIGVEFSGAKKSEIHQMKMNDGIMTMRPLAEGIVVPAGGKIELKPGGYHLMFMGISEQLTDGQTFPVTLTFANAGKVTLDFPVLERTKGKQLMMQEN